MIPLPDRRKFIASSSMLTLGGLALSSDTSPLPILGKAEHCIFIWLGGGMSQIDSLDPKRLGDPKLKIPGSYYKPIDTSVKGVQVSEHFSKIAPLLDRMTIIRSIHHDVIDEHAAAVNRMHTGRTVSGTVIYPSIGSTVARAIGVTTEEAPAYVLIGYPNITRGPGFLGSKYNYLYLTDTVSGPAGLSRPELITATRQKGREALLTELRKVNKIANKDKSIEDYESALEQSLKLSGPGFTKVFNLAEESGSLRDSYGGEFGQRCLLARRLVERGVRFVEVSHNLNFSNGTGWDVHNQGIEKQHILIQELDQAMAALVRDLDAKKMLEKTLIVISTEFGRPPEFDGGGGRGHQSKTFSVLLAGAGLKHRGAYGETDELSKKPLLDLVSVPDFFATIYASLGIDYAKNFYDGDRPVPLTDSGIPLKVLF